MSMFKKEGDNAVALTRWWGGLADRRGERAALVRAHDATELVLTPEYQRAWRRDFAELGKLQRDAMPAVLGLLARVRENDSRKLATALAKGKPDANRGLSELRFRRLLQSDTFDDFYSGLRRAVDLIGRRAPILELAELIYLWARIDQLENRATEPGASQLRLLDRLIGTRDRYSRQLAYDYYAQL